MSIKIVSKLLLKKTNKENEFLEEIKISTKFDHPSIIRILDTLHDEKNYYIVTEYCSG